MYEPALATPEPLLDDLRALCAQPASSGQPDELAATARLVAQMLRAVGLHVRLVRTDGAPVVLGWRDGQQPGRILFYHHYDVMPPGPWRAWFHEPFQLAEREGILYGRGVAHGKGPLAAHMHMLRSILQAGAELPCGVVLVVEGERLSGSPSLAAVVADHRDELQAQACLGVAGEHDANGRPFCYAGCKGLLRLRLSTQGPAYPLASGMAASVPNPLWRLTWALNQIKGEDEDIRINGFYNAIAGPASGERQLLRKAHLDEAGRMAAWQIGGFLFDMSGAALVRSEVTLPTCNLASLQVEPANGSQTIPVRATAQLDFQLVPDQEPAAVLDLLRKHLHEHGFDDIQIDELPGAYAPLRTPPAHALVQHIAAAGEQVYHEPLAVLPMGTFALPLHTLAQQIEAPAAVLALASATSATHGPNEQIALADLLHHSQVLAELLAVSSIHPDQLQMVS